MCIAAFKASNFYLLFMSHHTIVRSDYRMPKTGIRSKSVKMVVLILTKMFPKIYGEFYNSALGITVSIVEAGVNP